MRFGLILLDLRPLAQNGGTYLEPWARRKITCGPRAILAPIPPAAFYRLRLLPFLLLAPPLALRERAEERLLLELLALLGTGPATAPFLPVVPGAARLYEWTTVPSFLVY